MKATDSFALGGNEVDEIPSVEERYANPYTKGLWSIVAGYDPRKIPKKGFLVLKFYADDSSQTQPPIYVLGGYLAHISVWDKFSKDWGEALAEEPKLECLKTSSIRQDLGTNEKANAKLALLNSVIEKHIKYATAVAMDPRLIKKAFNHKDKISKHPFYSMASILVTDVAKMMRDLRLDFSGIEFVFDDQMMEESYFRSAWNFVRKEMSGCKDEVVQKLLKSSLNFKNDKEVPPIQAADMLVWKLRRAFHQQQVLDDVSPISWHSDKVICRLHTIDEYALLSRGRFSGN